MTRAFALLALCAAFLVVGMRCLGCYPSVEEEGSASLAFCPASGASSSDDGAMGGAIDDDDDEEGVGRAIAPSCVFAALPSAAASSKLCFGFGSEQRPLQRHRGTLDRPPRV